MVDVERILKEFEPVKTKRSYNENLWELIARYMLQRKSGFKGRVGAERFLQHEDVYTTTPRARPSIRLSPPLTGRCGRTAGTFGSC
jgi:hypothetical protein